MMSLREQVRGVLARRPSTTTEIAEGLGISTRETRSILSGMHRQVYRNESPHCPNENPWQLTPAGLGVTHRQQRKVYTGKPTPSHWEGLWRRTSVIDGQRTADYEESN